MSSLLAGQDYQIKCSTCDALFSGKITRRGRRRRFCSADCRHAATLRWKSKHNLKLRTAKRGPLLPLGIEDR